MENDWRTVHNMSGRPKGEQVLTEVVSAAAAGNLEKVKKLVEGDRTGRSVEDYGRLALYYAAANGHADVLEYFLSKTPISKRPQNKYRSRIVEEPSPQGTTALHVAAANGNYEAAKVLLDYDANPDKALSYTRGQYTPADFAFCYNHPRVYDLLIKHRATETDPRKCQMLQGESGRIRWGGGKRKTRKGKAVRRRRGTRRY